MKPASAPPHLAWLGALHEPHRVLAWALNDWEDVVRIARRLRLLGRLAHCVDNAGLTSRLPELVQRHLLAELRLSRWRLKALNWTMRQVAQQLAGADYPRVLLKGGAYVAQDLLIAQGRLPSDLDIMVPRYAIADAQRRLGEQGWHEVALDAHDRRYYHEWSHETPPMRNALFGMELDLHHNILPPVARTTVDASRLFTDCRPTGAGAWNVLSAVDQVLHAAAHLFLDSELRDRVRDVVDIDGLMRHHANQTDFWPDLIARADTLGLMEPLQLALRVSRGWMQTPVPASTLHVLSKHPISPLRQRWLLPMLDAAMTPSHPARPPERGQRLAALGVLFRYHRQRMPLRLLVPHLWHKMRSRQPSERDIDAGA